MRRDARIYECLHVVVFETALGVSGLHRSHQLVERGDDVGARRRSGAVDAVGQHRQVLRRKPALLQDVAEAHDVVSGTDEL